MNLDLAAELCMRFEGFRPKPYLCPAGVPTIGYGSTYYADGRRVAMQDAPITESIAKGMLLHELRSVCLPCVLRLCPILVQYERKVNAICDFVYNLGGGRLQTSTLRRLINIGDWESVSDELMKWTRGGGKVLPGLVARRAEEAKHIRG